MNYILKLWIITWKHENFMPPNQQSYSADVVATAKMHSSANLSQGTPEDKQDCYIFQNFLVYLDPSFQSDCSGKWN